MGSELFTVDSQRVTCGSPLVTFGSLFVKLSSPFITFISLFGNVCYLWLFICYIWLSICDPRVSVCYLWLSVFNLCLPIFHLLLSVCYLWLSFFPLTLCYLPMALRLLPLALRFAFYTFVLFDIFVLTDRQTSIYSFVFAFVAVDLAVLLTQKNNWQTKWKMTLQLKKLSAPSPNLKMLLLQREILYRGIPRPGGREFSWIYRKCIYEF